jgi:hypothetical protein
MTGQGWLYINNCEVLNDARFKAYVQQSTCLNCGTIQFGDNSEDSCPCEALSLDPCSDPQWDPITYPDVTTAPWYDPNRPIESGGFLGFWTLEVTGLDAGHWQRSINQRGSRRGGANLGPLRAGSRTLGWRVVAAACDECSLEYGLSWLEQILTGTCDPCTVSNAFVRVCCTDAADPTRGFYEIWDVGMLDGPKWGGSPLEGSRSMCNLREVSFSLAVGDPCKYRCSTVCLERQVFPVPGGG